uniref:Unannotated protein n=1 Tax=freshwater metagenome TaxID=449393 RepID=A0A6J7N4S1_9ZZZZ
MPEPAPQRIRGGLAHRHATLLGPLAPHGRDAHAQVEGIHVETAQFRDTHTAAVEHLEHCVVSESLPHGLVVCCRCVEQRVQFRGVEDSRQPSLPGRCTQAPGWVRLDETAPARPPEVATETRCMPCDRPLGEPSRGEVRKITAQDEAVDGLRALDIHSPRPFGEVCDVPAVGRDRVHGRRGERLHELVDVPGHGGHRTEVC